jgi:hypothetical protein
VAKLGIKPRTLKLLSSSINHTLRQAFMSVIPANLEAEIRREVPVWETVTDSPSQQINQDGHWWLTPVILATWEADSRRAAVQSQLGK